MESWSLEFEIKVSKHLNVLFHDLYQIASGTPIFRHCRSACFATFTDSSRSKLNFFYLPLKMHFELYVHDGFIQTVFPDQKETFGNFFKFTQNRLKE